MDLVIIEDKLGPSPQRWKPNPKCESINIYENIMLIG